MNGTRLVRESPLTNKQISIEPERVTREENEKERENKAYDKCIL
jgi:hypothetical protein